MSVFHTRRKRSLILTGLLCALWLLILLDCVAVGARESVWLALGMFLALVLIMLLKRAGGRLLRFFRRVLIFASAGMHAYVIGVTVFLLVFAAANTAVTVPGTVFLLGNDLKNNEPTELYLSRIRTAEQCMEREPSVTLIACGGLTGANTVTEAQAAEAVLIRDGIAPERILREDRSTRTWDNFSYAAELLEASGTWERRQPAAIITNRFHFYRASCLAREAGYSTLLLIPAGCRLPAELPWALREVMTVTKFWISGPC